MRWMGALLCLPLALAAQTRPDDLCAVSGQVTNAATGEPVRRANVVLRRVDVSPGTTNIQATNSGTTDAAGRFAITGIAPGRYRLSAERNGFISTQYGARGPNKAGTMLTLDPGQKSNDLLMRLTPHGVITGRVLDDEGEPVPNANVQVLRQQYMQGRKQMSRINGGSTNDLGEYRVFGLAPGRYFVSAENRPNPTMPQPEEEYVTTYFPRTTDATAAAALDVAPGAQVRNIDITLARMHTVTVTGRVTNEVHPAAGTEGAPRSNVNVMLSARNAVLGGGFNRGASLTPQGNFEFRGVIPGSYFVVGMTQMAGKTFTTKVPIQVGNSNVEGISFAIRAGVPVTGHVRVEGETTEKLTQVRVSLAPATTGGIMFGPLPNQQVKDGNFQLEDVNSDQYLLSVTGLPDGFYVKSVRSADLDVLANGLEISGSSPAPLDVVLSPHAAEVSGTVVDPKTQKPAAAVTVALVPQEKDRRNRDTFYRSTTTDQSGRFTFKGLVPGEYRVYAWEETEFGAWMDPDYLKPVESRGEAVSLSEGGRSTVQVNLIPADSQ